MGLSIEAIREQPDQHRVEIDFNVNGSQHSVYYQTADALLTVNTEALLAIALLPCMRGHIPCLVEGSASPRFLAGLQHIQQVLRSWKPNYTAVEFPNIRMEPRPESDEKRVGVFFSGGVDSFYTFLKHKDEITDLIFVHGFDIPLKEQSLRQRMSVSAQRVADHFGKHLIEVETNVRSFIDAYAFWGFAHGSGLASIGHLLYPHFQRIYIAASLDAPNQIHWGTHPDLDPHWGTEALEFIHDGVEARRIDKIGLISQYDIALQSLRVCLKSPQDFFNCGTCEKCVRTMIGLRAYGALERCPTFAAPLDNRRVYRMYAPADHLHEAFVRENLEVLDRTGADPELANALRRTEQLPRLVKNILRQVRRLRAKKRER
ncbi:MAG: hypothetical protein JXB15_00495 [Anaerolineales bacterium]|nr:hypothetical protein [Anaerolineales bacterium]